MTEKEKEVLRRLDITPGPWSRGTVLPTKRTARWSKVELHIAEEQENRMVFTNFSSLDEGRSRQIVCHCENKKDARLIAASPEMILALIETLIIAGDLSIGVFPAEKYDKDKAIIEAATGKEWKEVRQIWQEVMG